jgi:TetR/AcrR family transcriptional regulator, transcriptional repressor for nem operon
VKVVPTTDRGRATVGRVLEAACDLFNAQGIRSTSLDEIGTVAGVGRGQLYHFFVDKADLVAEVVTFQVERVIAELQPTMEAMSTSADVRAWCEAVVQSYTAPSGPIRCPLGSLINQLGDEDQGARSALQAGFARWEQLLEAGLRRVAETGGLRAGVDAEDLAAALLAAYQGGVLLTAVHGDVSPLRRALRGVTEVALADSAARISR